MSTSIQDLRSDLYRTINFISYKNKAQRVNYSRAKLENDLITKLEDLIEIIALGGEIPTNTFLGWQDYADSNTSEASPLEQTDIFGGEVQLTNNNNDTATDGNTNVNGNTTVTGVNDVWDTTTNTFTFKDTGLEKNDLFLIRFHVKENPTIVPQTFGIRMDFYDQPGGQGNYIFSLGGSGRTLTESAGVFEEDFIFVEGYFGESILNGSAKVFLEGTKSFEAEVIGWKINIYKIAR